jgi:hypothetical protein
MKGKFGGKIIQLSYLPKNYEGNFEENSGEMTFHAHKYVIPSNFTASETGSIIDLEKIPHVSDINSPIFNLENQVVGFLSEERSIKY